MVSANFTMLRKVQKCLIYISDEVVCHDRVRWETETQGCKEQETLMKLGERKKRLVKVPRRE